MLPLNPTPSGWGRLAIATVASIFLHCAVLMDSMGVVLLPSAPTQLVGEYFSSMPLTVVLRSAQVFELPSETSENQHSLVGVGKNRSFDQEASGKEPKEPKEQKSVSAREDFLTQDRVSVPAQPLSEINIPWPPGLPVMGVRSAIFTLFIDELGRVTDIVPDGHTLSPVMEEVARNAFLAATFRPALLNGKAVKSIKRIEVEFEFLPMPESVEAPEVVSRKELL